MGGSFDGKVRLFDRQEPERCRISVSGGGTLGTGSGTASFVITEIEPGKSRLDYDGEGEIGGLVAGVGQRVLGPVRSISLSNSSQNSGNISIKQTVLHNR